MSPAISYTEIATRMHSEILRDRAVYLVGSGISNAPPSNLPTARQVTEVFADLYWESQAVRDAWESNAAEFRDWLMGLWFEKVISPVPGDAFDEVLGLFWCDRPNSYHRFLASAVVDRGDYVITPNFDNGIESVDGTIQPVSKPEAFFDAYEHIKTSDRNDARMLLKVHGTVDAPDTVQALMKDVQASGRGFAIHFGKRQVIKHLFQNFPLIVVGYSASDVVDLWALLRETGCPHGVWWFFYSEKEGPTVFSGKQLESLRGTVRDDLIEFLIANRGTAVVCNPADFFDSLSTRLGYPAGPKTGDREGNTQILDRAQQILRNAILASPGDAEARLPFMVARTLILSVFDRPTPDPKSLERAIRLSKAAADSYDDQQRTRGFISASSIGALACNLSGNPQKAYEIYRNCLSTVNVPGLLTDASDLLNHAGMSLWRQVRSELDADAPESEVKMREAHSLLQAGAMVADALYHSADAIVTGPKVQKVRDDARRSRVNGITDLIAIRHRMFGAASVRETLGALEQMSRPVREVADLVWIYAFRSALCREEGDPIGALAYSQCALAEAESGVLPEEILGPLRDTRSDARLSVTQCDQVFLTRASRALGAEDFFAAYAFADAARKELQGKRLSDLLKVANLMFEAAMRGLTQLPAVQGRPSLEPPPPPPPPPPPSSFP